MPAPAHFSRPAPAIVTPDLTDRVNRVLNHAEFCGNQGDGNGGWVELWTLRKPLGQHPAGSTITRATMERLLFS